MIRKCVHKGTGEILEIHEKDSYLYNVGNDTWEPEYNLLFLDEGDIDEALELKYHRYLGEAS